jgi:hypothetical protein
MAKHRPRLNVFGRQLLVGRIVHEGKPAAQAADELGVSRSTASQPCARVERRATAAGASGCPGRACCCRPTAAVTTQLKTVDRG